MLATWSEKIAAILLILGLLGCVAKFVIEREL